MIIKYIALTLKIHIQNAICYTLDIREPYFLILMRIFFILFVATCPPNAQNAYWCNQYDDSICTKHSNMPNSCPYKCGLCLGKCTKRCH